MKHKIEAIIVSVNYIDNLEITLPINISNFDSVIIITTEKDKKTIDYLESLRDERIQIIKTNLFYFNNAKFNKGLAINVGFENLKYNEFICNLDSDIVLEKDFRNKFLQQNPNIEYFYGCPRRDFPTYKDWTNFTTGKKKLEHFLKYRGSGYGFCAIYHAQSFIFKNLKNINQGIINEKKMCLPYPYQFPNGSESDWIMRNYWGERVFNPVLGEFPECHSIPNNDYDSGLYRELPFECYHLGEVGKNHDKRITPEFK